MDVGLSFGTNQEDRFAHLRDARARVLALPGTRELASSSVYETEPVDVQPKYRDQGFLNTVMVVDITMSVDAFSDALHGIEKDMGRVRQDDRNAPRPIDIDIIYAEGVARDSAALTLPHARWAGRRFVVEPLAEIRPDLILQGYAQTVAEILNALPDVPTVSRLNTPW